MAHRNYLIIAGIAAATALAACSTTVTGSAEDAAPSAAIRFAAAPTKAAVTSETDMAAFAVWGWYRDDATTTPVSVFDETTVTPSSGQWTYDGTRYWLLGKTYNFTALHPANVANVTAGADGSITIEGFDATQSRDLMTASVTNRIYRAGGNNQVGFTFHHELARVQVVVNAGQRVKVDVSGAKVYGVSTSGDFARELGTSTATGPWTSLAPAVTEENTPYSFSGNTELDGDGATNQATVLDLAVIPQGITDARLVLTYQREGDTERTTEPLRLDQNSTTWSAGSAYRYTLNVEVDAITFSGFTVDEWGYSYSGGDINIGGTTNNGN